MKKIAFSGAGGTGKGTLLSLLKEELPSYAFLSSPVESFTKLMVPQAKNYRDIPFQKKVEAQYATVTAEMAREIFCAQEDRSFIAERSVLDFLPYMWQAISKQYGTDTYRIDIEYASYREYVNRYLKENLYDLLIVLPIEFEPKDKKTSSWKERDLAAREETEFQLRGIYDSYNGNILVARGTIEQRMKTITKELRSLR